MKLGVPFGVVNTMRTEEYEIKEVPNTEKSESTTIIREDTRKEGRVTVYQNNKLLIFFTVLLLVTFSFSQVLKK